MQFCLQMEEEFKKILEEIGEDIKREGLLKTPKRASEAFKFFTSGYNKELKSTVNGAVYDEKSSGIVVLKDIDFYSLCEHHLLPFFGKCHIGYFPDGKVIGISKLPRIVDMYSRRLQLQERMTSQIAEAVNDVIKPKGVCVVTQALHMCVMMRGVERHGSKTISNSMLGCFKKSRKAREEFLQFIGYKAIY